MTAIITMSVIIAQSSSTVFSRLAASVLGLIVTRVDVVCVSVSIYEISLVFLTTIVNLKRHTLCEMCEVFCH